MRDGMPDGTSVLDGISICICISKVVDIVT
jgi:hypothetical protein